MLGYTTLTIGIALILRPAARDVAAAAVLGTVVGVLRLLARGRRSLEVLMPFLAAFAVAALTALAVKHDITDPGLRAMIAALVVFIPGVALTTAFLELTEGQMISGSSRLVWAGTQLGLLAFGIVAGVSAAGVPAERAFSSSDALLGDWAPWLGVLVYGVGVTVAHSTPPGALISLLVVLYAAWTGQVVGNELFGAYSSGFVGAVVMTLVAYQLARLPVDDAGVRHVPPRLLAARTRLARADRADDLPRLPGVRVRHRRLRGDRGDRRGRTRRALRRRAPPLARGRGAPGPGAHTTRSAARCLSASRPSSTPRTSATDTRTALAATTRTTPGAADAPSVARASSQFSSAVQPITTPAPSTPITPIHDPRSSDGSHSSASTATIAASQPLFGPCVPSSLTGPSATQVTKTPTRTAATATLLTSRHVASLRSRGVESLMADDATTPARRRRGRKGVAIAGLALAAIFVGVYRQVLGITQRPSWPPPADAVTSADAQAATEAFVARGGMRPHDAALPFAWSTAASIEPLVEGVNFFPRIFADVEAARSSVHILMFGWREGEVGMEMAALLRRKLEEGVEVRVIVDGFGSRPYEEAREMFTGLAAAGAQIVVNDVFPLDRDGLFPDGQHIDWRQDEVGRADHRKLYVIDGAVAWTGGAGIEDHFRDGGFHDVMVRVTGAVVRQAQAAFLTSFRGHGGPLGADLSTYFPDPAEEGSTPIALAQVIPGGHVAASQAIREQIDGARRRLDVMNPYVTDADMIGRMLAAARRGVAVRLVVSETSNNGQATAALKHHYSELAEAGVELWELPGTVVHAKVVVADDVVSFGTVNLDAWALYRNSEVVMLAKSAEAAELIEERLFEPDIARSQRGVPPEGRASDSRAGSGTRWGRSCERLAGPAYLGARRYQHDTASAQHSVGALALESCDAQVAPAAHPRGRPVPDGAGPSS